MVDLEKLKSEFWDGQYKVDYENEKGKSEKKPTQFYFDEEGIKIAIKRALGDFTDRTERLKPEYKNQYFGAEQKYKALCGTDMEEDSEPKDGSFVQNFIDYFFKNPVEFKSQKDFDVWHKKMCDEFLNVIGPKYQGGLKYGKAQKIVNMTFKNAYCMQHNGIKEDKFEKYFEHCHMPLDSITLEWVKRTQAWLCSKSAESSGCKRKKAETLCSTKIPSWSNMENIDIVDDKKKIVQYGYITIQGKIREYLKEFADKNPATKYLIKACNAEIKKENLTPLQAEFFVWKYMQLELAAEGVYNQFLSFESMDSKEEKDKKEEYRNETINKKLADLKDKLKDIEKYKVQE